MMWIEDKIVWQKTSGYDEVLADRADDDGLIASWKLGRAGRKGGDDGGIQGSEMLTLLESLFNAETKSPNLVGAVGQKQGLKSLS